MLRKVIIFSVCAGTSASFPTLYESNQAMFQQMLSPFVSSDATTTASVAATPVSLQPDTAGGREVRLAADRRGHFTADFTLNGRSVEAMIDTGATAVAMNRSTARRIGVFPAQMEFTEEVDTANGRVRAALVTINRLQIGQISVDNVQAVVMDDKALSGTLVGMSFLSRLGKYQVENGTLLMVQ